MNKLIIELFNLMKDMTKLNFLSKSLENSKMNWNYNGYGNVTTKILESEHIKKIFFLENIFIKNQDGSDFEFTDKKLWIFNENNVEFHRYRNEKYEKIFDFILEDNNFIHINTYICGEDYYSGKLLVESNNLLNSEPEKNVIFTIKIKSNKKNEEIKYTYRKGTI